MRSLLLYDRKCILTDDDTVSKLRCVCAEKRFYILCKTSDGHVLKSRENEKTLSEAHLSDNSFLDLQYLRVDKKVFAATRDEVLIFSGDLHDEQRLPFPKPVRAVCWNDTQDTLAVYYEDGSVACVTINVENCKFGSIKDEFSSAGSRLDVGWGSENTQFKGKTEKTEKPSVRYVCMDDTVVINWRNNSEMFVVSFFDGEHRRIKVFRRNCELLYFSEKNNLLGLEVPVAFRPSGNLISCVLSTDGISQEIAFLEVNSDLEVRNLLKTEIKVEQLQWSPCSNFLTAWHQTDKIGFIDIYTSSNAIWSLKQRLKLSNDEKLVSYNCVATTPRTLSLDLHFSTSCYRFTFVQKVIRSETLAENLGLISVINGKSVHVYNPQIGIIPPGVDESHHTLEFDHCINMVVFDQFRQRLAIIDIHNHVSIYNYDPDWNKMCEFNLEDVDSNIPFSYKYIYFTPSELVAVSSDSGVKFTYVLAEAGLAGTALKSSCESNDCYGGYANNYSPPLFIPSDLIEAPVVSAYYFKYDDEYYSIYLTTDEVLKINDTVIRGHFSSIIRHDCYLLVTSKKHEDSDNLNDYLLCIKTDGGKLKQLYAGADIYKLSYVRFVEKGSILVTSVSHTSRIMMQLPRGNLETIEFRGIALSIINDLLLAGKIEEAYKIIQYQSFGLNLLVDLNPDLFLQNLQKIYSSIIPPDIMNKFLIEMNDKTMLDESDYTIVSIINFPDKRKKICTALLEVLLASKNPVLSLTTIVTAGLCSTSSKYNLKTAFNLLDGVCHGNYSTYKNYIIKAIEYLNHYVPYQDQYPIALSTYNLKLAEYIAEKSNMDPQFYREYLSQMESTNESETRFNINDSLAKYDRAVLYLLDMCIQNLHSYGNLFKYADEKGCIKTLYDNLDMQYPIYDEVAIRYANILIDKQQYNDAAAVLYKAQHYAKAIDVYLKADQWQHALSCVTMCSSHQADKKQHLTTLLEHLKLRGMFEEAAKIYLDHCNDFDNTITCLLEAHNYNEVLRLITAWDKVTYIESTLVPHLIQHIDGLNTALEGLEEAFHNFFNQLQSVRLKPARPSLIEDGITVTEFTEIDAFSDIDSVRTSTTRTSRTGSRHALKHAKREMRRYLDTRKGSKYEHIALMAKLHGIITESFSVCNKLAECCQLLENTHQSSTATFIKDLYNRIKDYEKAMQEASGTIWPDTLKKGVLVDLEPQLANIEHLDFKFRGKPDQMEVKYVKLYS